MEKQKKEITDFLVGLSDTKRYIIERAVSNHINDNHWF